MLAKSSYTTNNWREGEGGSCVITSASTQDKALYLIFIYLDKHLTTAPIETNPGI